MTRSGMDDGLIREQLDTYYAMVPGSLAGNLVNALVIIWLFHNDVSGQILTAFASIIAGLSCLRLIGLQRRHRETMSTQQAWRMLQSVRRQISILGLIWGASLAGLICIANATETAFLGMVAVGMMASASISMVSIEGAVKTYIGVVSLCMLSALIWVGTPLALTSAMLLVSFTFVLVRSSIVNYEHFVQRHHKEQQLREAADTVKIVLNDFQEHGSDWLWEVDCAGAIISPSSRFAEVAQQPVETLAGRQLVDLFTEGPERAMLGDHLSDARSFRGINVPLMVGGEQRWWSLSGHAFEKDDGQMRLRGVATDISAMKNAEVRVAYMAHYDGLTDLPNRFLFNDKLNHALHRQKEGLETIVLSIDLDHFKSVNDTLGHPAGDKLLQVVSRRIESCLKDRDIVARMGGDEFAVLCTGMRDHAAIERIAQRILAVINDPLSIDGHQVMTAASIGIAIAPEHGGTAELLMKHVDLALYDAKANGRNRFAFFDPSMDEAAQERRMIEMELRAAMNRDELTLHYQPLVDVGSGETMAYEALLRWHHPTRGLVMPNDFVPVAEETGLIVPLGEWVIRNAIAEVAKWHQNLGVSINLSPAQMKSSGLISTIVNAIARAQIAPHRVEFEITEAVLMQETEINLSTLNRLREIGVKIALDDFGTGYSSLNYLRSFPFDKIKIDRCFVEDIANRADNRAIIRAVTSLANSLGMITTAEGVENQEQYEQLRLEGCTQVQGFLFSKAVAAEQLTDLRSSFGSSVPPHVPGSVSAIPLTPPAQEQSTKLPESRKRGTRRS